MTEETLFESESTKTTADVATLLHHLGDSLRDTSSITFEQDDETTTVAVPSELSVGVEVERETGDDGGEEIEVEIEFEWAAEEAERSEEGEEVEKAERTEAEQEPDSEGVKSEEGVSGDAVSEDAVSEEAEPDSTEPDRTRAAEQRELAPIAESLDPNEPPRASLGRFEVFRDRADEWRWRLVHRNGNVIATSGEGYTSRQNAEKGLRSVMTNAPDADVITGER